MKLSARWVESTVSMNALWYRRSGSVSAAGHIVCQRSAATCDSWSASSAAICSSATSLAFSLAAPIDSSVSSPITRSAAPIGVSSV
jgi:hypothetical protein